MKKKDELTNLDSCMNHAEDDEMTFVLLARDAAAPDAVRHWAAQRVAIGKNLIDDRQITEALECAKAMEYWRKVNRR